MWNERTKQDRHEIPVGVQYQETRYGSLSDDTTLWDAHRPPANPYEALMVQGDTPADALMLQDAFFNIETAIKQAGLTDIQLLLGHQRATTTDIYLKSVSPDINHLAAIIESAVQPAASRMHEVEADG